MVNMGLILMTSSVLPLKFKKTFPITGIIMPVIGNAFLIEIAERKRLLAYVNHFICNYYII